MALRLAGLGLTQADVFDHQVALDEGKVGWVGGAEPQGFRVPAEGDELAGDIDFKGPEALLPFRESKTIFFEVREVFCLGGLRTVSALEGASGYGESERIPEADVQFVAGLGFAMPLNRHDDGTVIGVEDEAPLRVQADPEPLWPHIGSFGEAGALHLHPHPDKTEVSQAFGRQDEIDILPRGTREHQGE